jgi:superfamily II DNA or RNA helicase
VVATSAPSTAGDVLLPLKGFQQQARNVLVQVITETDRFIDADPSRRREIALQVGVSLLRSPTGSGKTLTIGRSLEGAVGQLRGRTVWIWLTPYSGLVTQSRDALAEQCPGLRLRDVALDRNVAMARDGDVYVTTWSNVATENKDARIIRRDDEDVPGFDLFVSALRASGFRIGLVIDEAHQNFGTTAVQASAFYSNVLAPDFTVLATATPRDQQLQAFESAVGIREINRIDVPREEVVRACLNKVGIKAVHFRADEKDERVLDMAEVAIFAGLERHRRIRDALVEKNVDLVPLLLIQVENAGPGEPDPIARVKTILDSLDVDRSRVAVHTSKEPDPFFHTLAYDERKDILVFKMSAATGFDAPRAWTLVSLRSSVGPEFGLQVIGRIMRVHPKVQALHPFAAEPPRSDLSLLDFGYVFLAHPAHQVGLVQAAAELNNLKGAIETLTDNVHVIDFGQGSQILLDPTQGFQELLVPSAPALPDDIARSGQTPSQVPPVDLAEPGAPVYLPLVAAQPYLALLSDELDAPARVNVATTEKEGEGRPPTPLFGYRLRDDIAFPQALAREVMPKSMDGLVRCISERVAIDDEALNLIYRNWGRVHVTEEELFGGERQTSVSNAPISAARIAAGAQAAFRFNDSIDERDLKPALLNRLRAAIVDKGLREPEERDLRRGVDLLGLLRPNLLTDACRSCLAGAVEVLQNEPIPELYQAPPNLEHARLSLYRVFPSDLNREELAFARLLDEDKTGTVLWWLRNPHNARWAVSIVLPNGERHFPDFVIGVNGNRRTLDNIALAEVKDDGSTGRLFSEKNGRKVRVQHSQYRRCLMVYRDDSSGWYQVAWRADLQRHVPAERFDIRQLEWTE